MNRNAATHPRDRVDFRTRKYLNAVFTKGLGQSIRDIMVFVFQDVISPLQDRDCTSEPAKHLAELDRDISASEDDEVLRNLIQFHEADVVQIGALIQSLDFGHERAQAGID